MFIHYSNPSTYSQVAQGLKKKKKLPANTRGAADTGLTPGSGSPGGGNGNHFRILALTEDHGKLQSVRSQRAGHD